MIYFVTKNTLFYKRQEIWFYNGENIPLLNNNIFYQAKSLPAFNVAWSGIFYTSCLDLKSDGDEIFKTVDPNYRNEIRRAEKHNCVFNVIDTPNEKDLSEYLFFYGQFSQIKKLLPPDRERVKALFSIPNFIITKIIYEGNSIVMHTYIHDNIRVRLLNSYHNINFSDNKLRGYFNKYLHWKDILFFKSKGLAVYDFGGISKEDRSGISVFKKSFGGYEEQSYDYIIAKGVYSYIRKIF